MTKRVGPEPTCDESAAVAHFARLSRAFMLADLFKRFAAHGPVCIASLSAIHTKEHA